MPGVEKCFLLTFYMILKKKCMFKHFLQDFIKKKKIVFMHFIYQMP